MSSSCLSPDQGSATTALAERLAAYNDLVRAVIHDLLQADSGLAPFYGMMLYHLGWVDTSFVPREARTGKSLRPALCMLLGEGLGAPAANLAHFAAGIELLHNFSLIHDDIEDRGATRRNRATVWSIWGEPQAINAGDGMLSLAHLAWLRSPMAESDPATFITAIRSAETTILRLCEGQFLDMSGEGSLDMTTSAYLAMIGRKTAGLIGEAAWLAARAAGIPVPLQEVGRAFGIDLGLAFQIRDDILGIWGDENETGKSASTDIATRKMTLPIIAALETGSPRVRGELRECYAAPHAGGDDQRVRDLLDRAGARQTVTAREDQYWQAAMKSLDALPLTTLWREDVREFARSFVGRSA